MTCVLDSQPPETCAGDGPWGTSLRSCVPSSQPVACVSSSLCIEFTEVRMSRAPLARVHELCTEFTSCGLCTEFTACDLCIEFTGRGAQLDADPGWARMRASPAGLEGLCTEFTTYGLCIEFPQAGGVQLGA